LPLRVQEDHWSLKRRLVKKPIPQLFSSPIFHTFFSRRDKRLSQIPSSVFFQSLLARRSRALRNCAPLLLFHIELPLQSSLDLFRPPLAYFDSGSQQCLLMSLPSPPFLSFRDLFPQREDFNPSYIFFLPSPVSLFAPEDGFAKPPAGLPVFPILSFCFIIFCPDYNRLRPKHVSLYLPRHPHFPCPTCWLGDVFSPPHKLPRYFFFPPQIPQGTTFYDFRFLSLFACQPVHVSADLLSPNSGLATLFLFFPYLDFSDGTAFLSKEWDAKCERSHEVPQTDLLWFFPFSFSLFVLSVSLVAGIFATPVGARFLFPTWIPPM